MLPLFTYGDAVNEDSAHVIKEPNFHQTERARFTWNTQTRILHLKSSHYGARQRKLWRIPPRDGMPWESQGTSEDKRRGARGGAFKDAARLG